MLEFWRSNSDVEGETAEGEGRVGGAVPPGVGAGVGLCWEFRPKEVGAGEGDGEGEGEGEGGTVFGG